jgi:cytochrome c peroxidase
MVLLVMLGASCEKDPIPSGVDLTHIPYSPEFFVDESIPYYYPDMVIPPDNPMTEAGIELGRFLFYDPILSRDSTVSCASCHHQELAFTDGVAVSVGIDGRLSKRSAMSLVNVGFYNNGFFWDGRTPGLESQSLHPIEDPLEMDFTLEEVEARLQAHPDYPARFRRAFGISNSSEVTIDLLAKAIAQFERTIVSVNSKFDYANWDRGVETQFFSNSELRGKILFTSEPQDQSDAHPACSHCHTGPLMTTNEYLNNGLTEAFSPSDFPDPGLGAITDKALDYGKFRVPTLRNIELTAPYMHDGRFQTLEEVLDHYRSGGHYSDNVDANIQPFPLTEQEKEDLLAFLRTMTDTILINNPDFSSPFK